MSTTVCYVCGAPCKFWGSYLRNCCTDCSSKIKIAAGYPAQMFEDGFPINDYWNPTLAQVKANFLKENMLNPAPFEVLKTKDTMKNSPQNRKALAEKVIDVLKEHMYPYGGYVRDKIAGDEFRDLDLFMPNNGTNSRYSKNSWVSLRDMSQRLVNAGLKVVAVPAAKQAYSMDSEVQLTKKKYEVSDANGNHIEIDLVQSDQYGAMDHPYPSLDADVNSLALDKNGQPWAVTGLPLEEVINHIKGRVFKVPSDSTLKGERVNKLLAKGYKVLSPGIEATAVKEGDRVKIRIEHQGVSYWKDATVLVPGTTYSSGIVALDEPVSVGMYTSTPLHSAYLSIAKKWGAKDNQWRVGNSEKNYTVIESVLQRVEARERLTLEKALPGTRVRCVGSSVTGYNGKFAKIVKASQYSVKVEWEDGSKENTQFSYLDSFQFIEAAPNTPEINKVKEVEIKEMKKHNVWSELQEGDLVELVIDDPSEEYNDDTDEYETIGEVKVQGTFLRFNDSGDAVFALEERYASDEMESMSYYDIDDGAIDRYIAKRFLPEDLADENIYWNVEQNNSETQINKVVKHQKPLTATKKEEKQNTMSSNGIDWKAVIIQDAGKATIRTGANLGIDGLKAGLEKILAHEGVDGPGAQAVMKFFNGPFGEALLRAGLGYTLLGLPIPFIQENEYAQKVSEELRVSGLSKGMDKGAEMVKTFIVPALMQSFQGTPLLEGIMNSGKTEEVAKPRIAESAAPQRIAAPASPVAEEGEIDVEFEETARAGARAAL